MQKAQPRGASHIDRAITSMQFHRFQFFWFGLNLQKSLREALSRCCGRATGLIVKFMDEQVLVPSAKSV
jgi:hypothetical protein